MGNRIQDLPLNPAAGLGVSLQNLAPLPWEGKDGAKVKDRLERRLQKLVCAGKLLRDDARRAIYVDWQGAYPRTPFSSLPWKFKDRFRH